jgi:hypothetical protein
MFLHYCPNEAVGKRRALRRTCSSSVYARATVRWSVNRSRTRSSGSAQGRAFQIDSDRGSGKTELSQGVAKLCLQCKHSLATDRHSSDPVLPPETNPTSGPTSRSSSVRNREPPNLDAAWTGAKLEARDDPLSIAQASTHELLQRLAAFECRLKKRVGDVAHSN